MDLSKRANLQGVREVRGLLRTDGASPAGVVGADWTGMCELRADGSDPDFFQFTGEASVAEHSYTVYDAYGEFTETMKTGFLARTLAQDPLVSFVYMHDMATVMAQTRGRNLELSETPHLAVAARLDKTDVDVQRVAPKTMRGDANSMSFGFRVTDQRWNEDYTEREILAVNLHGGDVSIITTGHGANPAASGSLREALDFDQVLRFLADADLDDEKRALMAAHVRSQEVKPPDAPQEIAEVPQSIREDLAALYAKMPLGV